MAERDRQDRGELRVGGGERGAQRADDQAPPVHERGEPERPGGLALGGRLEQVVPGLGIPAVLPGRSDQDTDRGFEGEPCEDVTEQQGRRLTGKWLSPSAATVSRNISPPTQGWIINLRIDSPHFSPGEWNRVAFYAIGCVTRHKVFAANPDMKFFPRSGGIYTGIKTPVPHVLL